MRFVYFGILSSLALVHVTSGDDLERLHWLAGGWRAEMGQLTIEEHWIPSSGGMMLGLARSVAGGKAVGFEFLRLETRDDSVFYIAQPNGHPGTEFELTELSGTSARFENPEHDHPKIILYRLRPDGTLWAKIESDEGEQEFEFQRIASP